MMMGKLLIISEGNPAKCPCGCGALLVHPGDKLKPGMQLDGRTGYWWLEKKSEAARARAQLFHERAITRDDRGISLLFKQLVSAVYWRIRSAPRRLRARVAWLLQSGERRRVRHAMDLELIERSEPYGYGPAEHAARLRLGLPPRVIT